MSNIITPVPSDFLQKEELKEYVDFINNYHTEETKSLHKHHIIPRSLGGSNNKTNLIKLTTLDHIHAHKLLYKCTKKLNNNVWTTKTKKGYTYLCTCLDVKQEYNVILSNGSTIKLSKDNSNLDLLDTLGLLSKPARDMFLIIKRSMSYKTNIGIYDNTSIDKSYKSKLLKELKDYDLVKKVIKSKVTFNNMPIATSSNMYMINPKYIIPANAYYEDIINNWSNL